MYPVGVLANQVEEPASQVKQDEQPMMYHLDGEYPVEKNSPSETLAVAEEAPVDVIEEPVSQVEQVEQPLMYQFDHSVPTNGSQIVEEEHVSQVEQAEQQPLTYNFDEAISPQHTVKSEIATHPKNNKPSEPVKKEEEPIAVVKKEPGWYKQMFQQFQSTVEEQLPGG